MIIPVTMFAPQTTGTFSPTDISGLQLWVRADSLSLTDGTGVTTWADESGNGNDLTQATSGSRPIYKTSIINGYPVVRSDGTKVISISSGTWPTTATIFAVAKLTTIGGVANYQRLITGGNDTHLFFGSLNGYFATFVGNGSAWNDVSHNGGTYVNDAFHVLEYVNNNTTLTPLVDGTAESGKTGTATAATGLRIFDGAGGGAGQTWIGDVAEIVYYDSALSSGNRSSVRGYLQTKYGL